MDEQNEPVYGPSPLCNAYPAFVAYMNCLKALGQSFIPRVDIFGDGIPRIKSLADVPLPDPLPDHVVKDSP